MGLTLSVGCVSIEHTSILPKEKKLEQAKKERELKLYHEVVAQDIPCVTKENFVFLATQLKRVIIPVDEIDGIIAIWNAKIKALGLEDIDLGVPAALLRQKEAAKEKVKQVKPVELGEIQKEIEIFLAASYNHRLYGGGLSWRDSLQFRLQNLHRLIGSALQAK